MENTELINYRVLATQAAHRAGHLLAAYFHRLDLAQIHCKSTPVDLASTADDEAEQLIRDLFTSKTPQFGFIGEESGTTQGTDNEYCWVVDPLDGTSNFLCGLPMWSVSIALCTPDLLPVVGVVHSPVLNRTWTAVLGMGTELNGSPLTVRPHPPGGGLSNAMLATGFPYDICTGGKHTNLDNFNAMQSQFHKIRRMGSAAIDLAFVAEGIFDGMWELKLRPWDTAAGVLLVTEAGGLVSRFDRSPFTPGDVDLLVAATPELQSMMLARLQPVE